MSQNAADRGDWRVPPALPHGPVYDPPRVIWRDPKYCSQTCITAGDLLPGYGTEVVYPDPRCLVHGDWETDLDIETTMWLNGAMTTTVLFENSDYDLTDLEDRFDLYRQADGVPTLDRGLHLVFDEQMDLMQPTCSICDGLGHGYPGAGPCPLEERGEEGVPWWAS